MFAPAWPVRTAFWWAGCAFGAAAALAAHAVNPLLLLDVFVGAVALQLAGRVLPDLLLGPDPRQRACAGLLLPLTAIAFVLGAWAWWGDTGWAVVAGSLVAVPVSEVLLGALFPRIAAGTPPETP